jgi:hypothetical protein
VLSQRCRNGLFTAALWLLGGAVAFGQSPPRGELLSDESVRQHVSLALANLKGAKCSGDQLCAPATPAEIAKPPITLDEARSVIQRGMLSGAAGACDLDWANGSFLPMMSYWRQSQRKTERQMALIGLLHGIAQGQALRALSTKPCDAELRRNLEAQLSQAKKS